MYNTSAAASSYILAGFTIEVFLSIVHPVLHKNFFKRRLVVLIVIFCWLSSFALNFGVNFASTRIINGYCYLYYDWAKIKDSVSIANFMWKVIIPTGCYIMSYLLMIQKLKVRVKVNSINANLNNRNNTPSQLNASSDRFSKARYNVVIVLLYTVIIHVISWGGHQIIVLLITLGYPIQPTGLVPQMLLLATYMSGCINPIIYTIRYENFRRAVRNLLYRGVQNNLEMR